ncbi:PLC-like phosphodiesterase [Trichoderma sp. SZMC 28014]
MLLLRWLFIFLGLTSPVAGLPIVGSKAKVPVHSRPVVLLTGNEESSSSPNSRPTILHKGNEESSSLPNSQPTVLHEGYKVSLSDSSSAVLHKNGKRWSFSPNHVDETWMVLINATPYMWKRGYIHQYQMPDWPSACPEYILPGQSVSVLIQPAKGAFNWRDSGAEVEYHLMGTSEPTSFMASFSNHHPSSLEIQFREELFSVNNLKHSKHDLGVQRFPGGSAFILAGTEGEFISNDPPIDWMQAMLPELADVPLRKIILPRSHHSGMWKTFRGVGFASEANTVTQSIHLSHQLGDGGIRVLDFRPVRIGDDFHESHGDHLLGMYHGHLGASLSEMIGFVNEFNQKYPGELIIWDVHGDQAWNGDHGYRSLDQQDREALYAQFLNLEHRMSFPDNDTDVSQWPLDRFIGNRSSAVIVNFDETWRQMDGDAFPGSQQGFVTGRNFPLTHQWSNAGHVHDMVRDQVNKFHEVRRTADSPVHIADWVLTQQGIEAALPTHSILELAAPAWRSLFEDLWRQSTSETYPNWVGVDNVRGNQHKSLIMAMNHCLVAKKCGEMLGKVKMGDDGK